MQSFGCKALSENDIKTGMDEQMKKGFWKENRSILFFLVTTGLTISCEPGAKCKPESECEPESERKPGTECESGTKCESGAKCESPADCGRQ